MNNVNVREPAHEIEHHDNHGSSPQVLETVQVQTENWLCYVFRGYRGRLFDFFRESLPHTLEYILDPSVVHENV